jgi:anti-sigma B factor antagonist
LPVNSLFSTAPLENGKLLLELKVANVDFRNTDALKAQISQVVAQGNAHLVLDLSQVAFMDSSGLSLILFCKRTCEEAKGTISLRTLQAYVQNLVKLTNLDRTITIES